MTRFLGFSFLIGGNGPVYLERYTIRDREGSIRLFEAVLEVATVLILAGVDSAQGRVDDEVSSALRCVSTFLFLRAQQYTLVTFLQEQLRIHLMSEVLSLLQLFAAAINPARTNVPFSSPETSRTQASLDFLRFGFCRHLFSLRSPRGSERPRLPRRPPSINRREPSRDTRGSSSARSLMAPAIPPPGALRHCHIRARGDHQALGTAQKMSGRLGRAVVDGMRAGHWVGNKPQGLQQGDCSTCSLALSFMS